MIFDLILVMMIIVALTRASAKGCTEDMNFAIGFLIVVRISGIFYMPVSKIFLKFTDSEFLSACAGYVTLAIILFFIFNAVAGHRIIDLGKKIPKTTAYVFTYFFAVIKTVMIFSLIFGLIYTFPILKRAPDKYVTPTSFGITEAFLGQGTSGLFHKLAAYMTEKINAPVDFMIKQQQKQSRGASMQEEAAQSILKTKEGKKADKKIIPPAAADEENK